ncbi:hypothetical protein GC173_13735 [bacterium]|nr:hypothetical protein [bacterium]
MRIPLLILATMLAGASAPAAEVTSPTVTLRIAARMVESDPVLGLIPVGPAKIQQRTREGKVAEALAEYGTVAQPLEGELTLSESEPSGTLTDQSERSRRALTGGLSASRLLGKARLDFDQAFLQQQDRVQLVGRQRLSVTAPQALFDQPAFVAAGFDLTGTDGIRSTFVTATTASTTTATGQFLEVFVVAVEPTAGKSPWTSLSDPAVLGQDNGYDLMAKAGLPGTIRRAAYVTWVGGGAATIFTGGETPFVSSTTDASTPGGAAVRRITQGTIQSGLRFTLEPTEGGNWHFEATADEAYVPAMGGSPTRSTTAWDGSVTLTPGVFSAHYRTPAEVTWEGTPTEEQRGGHLLLFRLAKIER